MVMLRLLNTLSTIKSKAVLKVKTTAGATMFYQLVTMMYFLLFVENAEDRARFLSTQSSRNYVLLI